MPVETTKPGFQAVGKYDLVEKIAEGGMGTVWKARDRESGLMVALKIMPAHLASNPILKKRFEQEYQAARALEHPNIVHAIEFGFENGLPYLVMELVEGESLGQRLERVQRLPENEAIRIIAQVAQGLHKAHKLGLVHRDIKPDNILLTNDGQVKVADLGLVKEIDTNLNLTRTGRGLGTPHFMAPEQFRNAKKADARCDIYSMAATLYMMVTGELPFKSCGPLDAWMKKVNNEIKSVREVVPTLSERIDWAIRRGMSADPTQRASSCREFVEDLTGHSTRRTATGETSQASADLWFLVYQDEEGVAHTVKGTQAAIRRSLKEGLLGDASNIRASRSKTGPFDQLRSFPEFRDLVLEVGAATMAGADSQTEPMAPSRTRPQAGSPLPRQRTPEAKQPPSPLSREPVANQGEPSSLELPDFPLPSSTSGAFPAPPSGTAIPNSGAVPRIDLEKNSNQGEWVRWAVLFLFAAAAGVVLFFLLPLLSGLRWK